MNELKQMISVRLLESDRVAIKAVASRLFIRESDVYRCAINFFLNRYHCLTDSAFTGSDLLLAFCEIRTEINQTIHLKKHLLDRILNGNNLDPDKYVAMSDIELLLMPQHLLRQRLIKLTGITSGAIDVEEKLKAYFIDKYKLNEPEPIGLVTEAPEQISQNVS